MFFFSSFCDFFLFFFFVFFLCSSFYDPFLYVFFLCISSFSFILFFSFCVFFWNYPSIFSAFLLFLFFFPFFFYISLSIEHRVANIYNINIIQSIKYLVLKIKRVSPKLQEQIYLLLLRIMSLWGNKAGFTQTNIQQHEQDEYDS